ncbi:MAG: UDP-N-acetylmuramoyl-L-alanyl-D-glutamate--2,6-diaminopimelate ligase [Holosporales bacterium]|jgi:UDP-N-acetylmuramoyl-L-alanyl-D-glutamate--2,6-diaminopimelate ligase|nr:UDP-N-acetylmuramoyl-L-alanyl-D-glutamate--2,6-diaminopimelate ligase [Holosporales bacterium]
MNSSFFLDNFGVSVPNIAISGISSDSRLVRPGHVFVATHAAKKYVPEAIANGAAVIVTEDNDLLGKCPVACVYVENARLALAKFCREFYPNVPEVLLAVTGTNGKSSSVIFATQMLSALGIPSASMGTLGVCVPPLLGVAPASNVVNAAPQFDPPPLTTYDPISLHKILPQLCCFGVRCAAIEATSHGLHQFRLDGLRFDAAALTNVTQDHLDYHGDMDAYIAAKTRLFRDLVKDGGTAVLALNSPACFFEVCNRRGMRVITYSCGESPAADIVAYNIKLNDNSISFDVRVFAQNFENITYHGIGAFQVENLLCALCLIIVAYPNVPVHDAVAAIAHTSPVPGRMEMAARYNGASIFVDFCHTPDALSKVLTDLKKIAHKSLVVVFGCGGERDKGKRAQMGQVAASLASRVIVTDDNPRFEDAQAIRWDVLSGISNLNHIVEIPGRREAISRAIADLGEEDILLVSGRGHESCQIINGDRIPFSDSAYVREVVEGMSLCQV